MDRQLEKRFWTAKRVAGLTVGLALVPLAVYTLSGDLGTSRLNVDARKLIVSTVERGPFQEFIAVTGNVMPIQTVYLETADGGRVEEIFLEEGSLARAGERILRLDNTDLQLDIMRREDQLSEAANQLFNTRLQMEQQRSSFDQQMADLDYQILKQKRTYERNAVLAEEKLLSRMEFELSQDEYEYLQKQRELALEREQEDRVFRKAQVQQMEKSVERVRRNLATAREKLEKLVIRAPIDGQLTSLEAEVGQSMFPGDRLGQIDATHGFKVRAAIDQHYISRVGVGQEGEFDFAGGAHPLRIEKVYPEVADGRFEVDLEFAGDAPQQVRRGQTLHIRLALGDLSEVLRLAKGPFFQRTGGQWAFIVEDGVATKTPVRLGRQNPDFFEVVEGLASGDRIITSSYDTFAEFDELVLEQ